MNATFRARLPSLQPAYAAAHFRATPADHEQ